MGTHKLIILRHGESQWNHENKFCGWIDIPLTEKGKEEAEYAGELIKQHGLSPDILYTSKLIRSIETGFIILKVLNKPWVDHIKTWRLNERHYGKYQGRDKHEVFVELGEDKDKFTEAIGFGYAAGYLTGFATASSSTGPASSGGSGYDTITGQKLTTELQELKKLQQQISAMSPEEKEREAEKLMYLFNRMKELGIVNFEHPMRAAQESGRFEELD